MNSKIQQLLTNFGSFYVLIIFLLCLIFRQEWIRIKYYAKLAALSSADDEVIVEDDDEDEDPLADDVIIPAAICNVIMED